MQIETKINIIPQKGDDSDLFERLKEFIMYFEPEWINRIKPASDQDILLLKKLSGINGRGIPKYYEIFLNYLGENDGGVLTTKEGTSSIKEIIELYEEIHKFEPDTLNSNYLIFYNEYLASQVALELGKSENPLVVDFAVGEVCDMRSESFEKLLFQYAYRKYIQYKYIVRFGASGNTLTNALIQYGNKEDAIFNLLDNFRRKNKFDKVWISDEWNYIAVNARASFYIKYQRIGLGISGHVTGLDKDYVLEIANLLSVEIGAEVHDIEIKDSI